MNLSARISRIEHKAFPGDPLEDLTDEELDAAIAKARARIEAATGMTEFQLARDLDQRQKDGALPDDLNPATVAGYVRAIKAELKATGAATW